MEPLDFLRILRQRWKIVVAALVIAAGAAWVTTPATQEFGPPILSYTASATLLQQPNADVSLPFVALLATKGRIPEVAAKTLGFTDDPALLASSVSVVPDPEVGTLTFTSSDSDGKQAAATANAFADATIKVLAEDSRQQRQAQIDELQSSITQNQEKVAELQPKVKAKPDDILLEAQLSAYEQQLTAASSQLVSLYSQAGQGADLTVLQEATPLPVSSGGGFAPPSSRKGRVLLGLGVGLALGLLLVLLMDRLDTKLRRREEVEDAYRLPVVAEIPLLPRRGRKRAVSEAVRDPAGPLADSYRSLRTSLALLPSRRLGSAVWGEAEPGEDTTRGAVSQMPQVVLVTSARASEGKSTSAAILAATLAETGKRVLVIDADFHHATMPRLLDASPGPGLADLLSPDADVHLRIMDRPTGHPRIRLLTAGNAQDYRGTLPTSIARAIEETRAYADVIIIDTAPVLGTNDALDFLPYVDTVVVVARLGKLTRSQASRVADLLGRARVPVLGVVTIGGRNSLGYGAYGAYGATDSWRARRSRHRAKRKVSTS